MTNRVPRRGSYGIDAPSTLFGLGCGAVGLTAATVATAMTPWRVAAVAPFVGAVSFAFSTAMYAHSTKRGKFEVWAELLDEVKLRGDERVLDLGCGRGAVLLAVAQRLSTGRAVGVDLWRTQDQSGNAQAITERNALAEGVADRIELHTADLRELPFGDGEFDLVVSSLAIHNIKAAAGRSQAIDEAVRVLRPGGRLLIADIDVANTVRQYQSRLEELGMSDVELRSLGWRMWWGGPWFATRLASAVKP